MDNKADEICLECGHRRGYHDGMGCTDQLPDGTPCPCSIAIDMPGSEPHFLPIAEIQAKLILEE